jgi:transposase
MARPTKMTPEVVKRIADALAAGNTRRAAAAYGGIDEDTLGRWLRRFADFAAHVANITQAAKDGTWQASAWWLERRQHAAWGKVDRVEIEIRRAAERVAQQTGADPEWLVKRAAEIVAGSQSEGVTG